MEFFVACWASSGYNVAGCQALETQLRACMDTKVGYNVQNTLKWRLTSMSCRGPKIRSRITSITIYQGSIPRSLGRGRGSEPDDSNELNL